MRFYDALQMNPNDLKNAIRAADSKQEKTRLHWAMLVRAVLLVAFSILLIAPITAVFGQENSSVGVALLCIILAIRFVDFGYCIGDSVRNLGLCFLILLAAPALTAVLHPLAAALLHFAAMLLLLTMTSDRPEMGNGGLYAFSYIFLVGNPVSGELLFRRGILLFLGWLFCSAILYAKHRGKHQEVRFRHLAAGFSMKDRKCRWQLQFALGVSLILTLGSVFHLERFMWAGFACASLLGCYSSSSDSLQDTRERFADRVIGAVFGSVLFAGIYQLVPVSLHGLFGPVGGICLGFCTDYRYKTALNCFGALMLATGLYGMEGSVLLRIGNNLLGAAFGYGFFLLYRTLVDRRFESAAA